MPSIDERVVAMSFENAKFEAGVAQTMSTLSKLEASISKIGGTSGFSKIETEASKVTFQGPMSALDKLKARLGFIGSTKGFSDVEKEADKVTLTGPMSALDKLRSRLGFIGDTKGFTDIERAADNVTLSGLGNAVDGMRVKFGALQAVALGALGQIGAKASQVGGGLIKDLTVGPISSGLDEYATNLGSIQTILANTKDSGGNLQSVNAALQELNAYSDKTIYNFSQMAKNIGTFTAAGVDLKTATGSIKGIANLAALSGSTSEQASTAMYQLSQAIAAGRVSLQDWNSVVNAGMGGAVFQKALARSAVAMGTINKNAVKVDKTTGKLTINGESFRESITAKPGEKSWLSSEVLTGTLNQFTGDMNDAQLAAQGFSKDQIKAIRDQATMAQKAATESKTLKQVWDVTKEAMGSGWAQTWQVIFGDFNEAKGLFTGLANSISGIIGRSAKTRNKILGDWKKLGGRNLLIESLKDGLKALGDILGSVKGAFRDVFPAQTGKSLFELTKRFSEFTKSLKASPETLDNLRRTFRGLFAVLHIGWTIVKRTAGVIADLLGVVGEGSGGFLAFTGGIGDFITSLDKAVSKGHALDGFFNGLTAVLRIPLEILKELASAFFGLFDGMDAPKADATGKAIGGVNSNLRPMKKILEGVIDAWDRFMGFFDKIRDAVAPFMHKIGEQFSGLGNIIADAINNLDSEKIMSAIQTTLLGGIFLTLKKALGGGVNVVVGKLDGLNGVFGALTGNLKAMQRNVQAGTLLKIAAAIATLAAGVTLLARIDPKDLTRAMTAVAVGLGQLVAALAILGKVSSGMSFVTLPVLASGLVILATSLVILAGAVKLFSMMSWDELVRGLVGVGGALTAIGVGMQFIGPSVTLAAPGILAIALAMNVLGVAMRIFGGMSWDEIGKGIIGMAGALTALAVGTAALGPELLLTGPGLIAVALGMTLLSGAVMSFGSMSWGDMAKGILGLAGALLAIGISIESIPPTVAAQAAGLVILAVALTGIAGAVKMMGGMDVATIAKGLITLGGALFILAVGLETMIGTIPGSVALLAAAAALSILTPTLAFMGTLKWSTIFKGLGGIALALGTLALVGAVASSGLLALGIALTALSVAVLATGAGFFLLAAAFKVIGETGTKAIGVMVASITAFIAVLPKLVIDFIKGLVEIIKATAELAPKVVEALSKIIMSMLDVVINAVPKMAEAAGALMMAFVKVVNENSGPLIEAGAKLILQLLHGISAHIVEVTNTAAEIIVKFLGALTAHIPALVAAGTRTIVAFLQGIANAVGRVVPAAIDVVLRFVRAVTSKIPDVIAAGVTIITSVLSGIAQQIPKIRRSAIHLVRVFLNNFAKALVDLADVAFDAIITWAEGLAKVIRNRAPELRNAGKHLAGAILSGLTFGLSDKAANAANDVVDTLSGIVGKKKKPSASDRAAGGSLGANFGGKRGGSRKRLIADDVLDQVAPVMDIRPTITPVVDLTNVEQGAKKITGLMDVAPDTSLDQAAIISADRTAADLATAEAAAQPPVKEIKFEQNNYSPEALSELEIYRRTNNQLGAAKTALLGAPA